MLSKELIYHQVNFLQIQDLPLHKLIVQVLVKEVKHYEPAFGEVANAVSNTTVTFDTAINSKISRQRSRSEQT